MYIYFPIFLLRVLISSLSSPWFVSIRSSLVFCSSLYLPSACDPDDLDPLHAAMGQGLDLGLELEPPPPGGEGEEGVGQSLSMHDDSPLLAVDDGGDNDNVGRVGKGNNNGNNSVKEQDSDSDGDNSMLNDSLDVGQPQQLPQPPPQPQPLPSSSSPPIPPFVLSQHFSSTDIQLMKEVLPHVPALRITFTHSYHLFSITFSLLFHPTYHPRYLWTFRMRSCCWGRRCVDTFTTR